MPRRAYIRTGMRFAISLHCCAEYPCQGGGREHGARQLIVAQIQNGQVGELGQFWGQRGQLVAADVQLPEVSQPAQFRGSVVKRFPERSRCANGSVGPQEAKYSKARMSGGNRGW